MADWWLRRGKATSRLSDFNLLPPGYDTLIAFLAGCAAVIPFMNTTYYVGPVANALHGGDLGYYVGFIVSGTVYYLIKKVFRSGADLVHEEPAVPGSGSRVGPPAA